MQIGFVGLGMMGTPMAANLRKAGFPLRVADLDAERVARFCAQHGALPLEPQHAAPHSLDVLITMLPDSDAVESALLDDPGWATRLRPGATVIDMSTCEPTRSRSLGESLQQRGLDYLDAPVSGGVAKAAGGTLAIMVGGDAGAFGRCAEIFSAMGQRVFHVGAAGSGHAIKALNNYLSAASLASMAEALVIGERFGLDPNVMIDVFNASTGRSNSTENKAKQFVVNRAFGDGFALKLMVKDLGIAARLGADVGANARLSEEVRDLFAAALAALGGNPDHTELYRYIEKRANADRGGRRT